MRASLAALPPGYFGLVMATGIVSLAASQLGHAAIAHGLLAANVVFYVVLWALNVLRFARHRGPMLADGADPAHGPGYFTWVAATGVLASELVVIEGRYAIAQALWIVTVALWALMTYAIFAAFTVKAEKAPLERAVNGTWLLAVVATQSVAVLSALLAAHDPSPYRRELDFLALSMWLCGGMLYLWIIGLIFERYMFHRITAEELTPPYWINMGAMAISTLAGSLLVLNAPQAPLLESVLPFLRGLTILYWATGTWWIPMLVVLGLWRYVAKRYPVKYTPMYWSAVFPLGMYAAATHQLVRALDLPFLAGVPVLFFWIALASWALAAIGFVRNLAGSR